MEEKSVQYSGTVVEVPSKTIVIGGRAYTLTKKRDITDVVGEKLSNAEIKEKLNNGKEAHFQNKNRLALDKKKVLVILLQLVIDKDNLFFRVLDNFYFR